jgi:hypothetical protein
VERLAARRPGHSAAPRRPPRPRAPRGLRRRRHAGLFRRSFGPWTLLFNTGGVGLAHQPGHIHADGLAIELSLHGERVVIDAGVGTYVPGSSRDYARSTRAHNTVTVGEGDPNQHELWASHRVGGRARTTDLSMGQITSRPACSATGPPGRTAGACTGTASA